MYYPRTSCASRISSLSPCDEPGYGSLSPAADFQIIGSRLAPADRLLAVEPFPYDGRPAPHHRTVDLGPRWRIADGGHAVIARPGLDAVERPSRRKPDQGLARGERRCGGARMAWRAGLVYLAGSDRVQAHAGSVGAAQRVAVVDARDPASEGWKHTRDLAGRGHRSQLALLDRGLDLRPEESACEAQEHGRSDQRRERPVPALLPGGRNGKPGLRHPPAESHVRKDSEKDDPSQRHPHHHINQHAQLVDCKPAAHEQHKDRRIPHDARRNGLERDRARMGRPMIV